MFITSFCLLIFTKSHEKEKSQELEQIFTQGFLSKKKISRLFYVSSVANRWQRIDFFVFPETRFTLRWGSVPATFLLVLSDSLIRKLWNQRTASRLHQDVRGLWTINISCNWSIVIVETKDQSFVSCPDYAAGKLEFKQCLTHDKLARHLVMTMINYEWQ